MTQKANKLKANSVAVAEPTSPRETDASNVNRHSPKYIVGMGGSAGGLDAFEDFFRNMPVNTGMAFVLVSHLDPTHKGVMPELIQRSTAMNVKQAKDGMKVQPNHVYVIPPNKDMSITHGVLQLLEPSMPRGLRMPIDYFFRHLAEDQREKSVGIILSGMGTDGTLGLKAIKEDLGMAMVQDVGSAKYSGMPESAINTGLVDFIAPASELPTKLLGYADHFMISEKDRSPKEKRVTGVMQKIFALLQERTGNDFSLYKKNTVRRRIERRMSVHQIGSISQYVRYLQQNSQEIDLLFKELLIGVTNFFREPEAFEVLKRDTIPEFLKRKKDGDPIRVWVVGCSTGEEAYSIAIILKECIEELKLKHRKIQIYATDIDKAAIDNARQGIYPANIAADVSQDRLQRFFSEEDGRYRIKKEVRDSIVFAPQNVLTDPPFTKLDLLSCRNLLIYLNTETQKKLLPLFHYTLNPGGYLFFGSSETIGTFTDLFSPVDNKWKIFQRKESLMARKEYVEFPATAPSYEARLQGSAEPQKKPEINVAENAKNIILQTIAPPAVIINEKGDILYITRRTGKYLEPPIGKASMNILAMAREGLRTELGIAIRRAANDLQTVAMKGLKVKTNGSEQMINLKVMPIGEPDSMRGLMMVIFEDIEKPTETTTSARTRSKSASRLEIINSELEKELQYTKEHLQTVVEEMETSQEELKSTNEELQSTNEELQSTNEEMVTSKEELQSLNEELTTLNTELQSKNEELTETNNDMKNLLNSTQIPTIFLDNNLNIKRFTPYATKIASLIQSDIGRPITDIMLNIQYKNLIQDVKEVLQTLVFKEAQVQSENGSWYLMRIIPYRTSENVIKGVVITFSDVTEFKNTTASLTESTEFAEQIFRTTHEPMLVLNDEQKIVSANPSFYKTFQLTPQETEGQFLYQLANGHWDIPALRELVENVLPENEQIEGYMVEHDFPRIGHKKIMLNARKIMHDNPKKRQILLAIEDITPCT